MQRAGRRQIAAAADRGVAADPRGAAPPSDLLRRAPGRRTRRGAAQPSPRRVLAAEPPGSGHPATVTRSPWAQAPAPLPSSGVRAQPRSLPARARRVHVKPAHRTISAARTPASTGGTSLTVSSWTLRGVIPALGRTPALRGYPGGIDAAGPGWLSLTGGGDQPDPGPASAPETIVAAAGGPVTRGAPGTATEPRPGKRQRTRGKRPRGPATSRALAGADGRSVWQQSLSAWREAGLEWQRLAGWEPADADEQRTEPIPVVPAMVPLDAGPAAAPPSGGAVRQAGPPRGRAGRHPAPPPGPAGQPRGPAARTPGAAAARSWSVPRPAWRCSPWRSLASSSPAGRALAVARPGWCWPPARPARRCAVRRAGRSTRAGSAALAHRGGRVRPHGGGGGLAGRASLRPPAGPHVTRWRPHVAVDGLARPGRRGDAADGCRWPRADGWR